MKGQAEILDLKTTTLHLKTPKENVSKLKESNRNAIHSEAKKNKRWEKNHTGVPGTYGMKINTLNGVLRIG